MSENNFLNLIISEKLFNENIVDEKLYTDWKNLTESYAFKPENLISEDNDVPTINVPYTICECIVALIAVIGNAMVITVFIKERRLRRRTNYYIVSLAMADFFVGLLGVPFAILASLGIPNNLYACLFSLSLLVVLCTISIFCLVAVSVDRYWAILHPMAYSRNVRTKTAIGIIAMCWLAGGIVGFLPVFGIHQEWTNNGKCYFVKVMNYNYLVFLYFATIITPALILVAFYAHIYRVIIKQVRQIVTMNPVGENHNRRESLLTSSRQRHRSQSPPTATTNNIRLPRQSNSVTGSGTMLRVLGAAQKREVKATQNLSIIVLFFMICWIPLYTINCVKAFCNECIVSQNMTSLFIILSHLNSAVNPLLYAYHLRDFRAALKNFILIMIGREPSTQQNDLNYRLSLASQQQQHRLQSILEKRASFQPRVYIDSPVWLRSQQITINPNNHLIENNNCIDNSREIWNIVEVPSTLEENSHVLNDQEHSEITIEKYADMDDDHDSGKNVSSEVNNECKNDYDEFDPDDEEDDDVFVSQSSSSEPYLIKDKQNSKVFSINKHKESTESTDYYFSTELPFYEEQQKVKEENIKIPLSQSSTVIQEILINVSNTSDEDKSEPTNCNQDSKIEPNIFLIENRNYDSPKIIQTNKYIYKNSVYSNRRLTTTNNICNNRNVLFNRGHSSSLSSENIYKPSSLKVVSSFIFPSQNTHSSIFNCLDRRNISIGANTLKRTLSDS